MRYFIIHLIGTKWL